MGKIRILPQNLINLIAAGEVVERPASALKELLENSIDANATEIIVRLENYGLDTISIKDNGVGMTKEDAIMAFKQHATSKIISEDDLHRIVTMGFRGEALASISSVAESIEVETKTEGSKAVKFIIRQTEIEEKPSTKTENGTLIKINKLFENIPARKKFLKTPQTEYRYITDIFLNVALVHTGMHFELYNNNKLVYKLTKTDNIKNRIFEVWGGLAKNLFEETLFDSPQLKIKGIFGKSEAARKTSGIQYIYLNNRYIQSKVVSAAAQEGYSGFIHKDLKPSYFIFIEINPEEVDVNIHPRKMEAKFAKSDEIFRSVLTLTKKTLEKNTKDIINASFSSISSQNYSQPRTIIQNEDTNPRKRFSNSYTSKERSKISDAMTFTKELLQPIKHVADSVAEVSLMQDSLKPFQVFNTYIVVEKDNKLIFVDQHAAAEKIMFEKLVSQMGKLQKKLLLVPEIIDLPKDSKEYILSHKEQFEDLGFSIEDMGLDSIQVLEIPEILNKFDIKEYIESILQPEGNIVANFGQFETYNGIKLTRDIYLIIATAACHSSVRAGQKLSENEMLNILKDLNLLYNPYNCPHGRPVIWELSRYDLEKGFKRKI